MDSSILNLGLALQSCGFADSFFSNEIEERTLGYFPVPPNETGRSKAEGNPFARVRNKERNAFMTKYKHKPNPFDLGKVNYGVYPFGVSFSEIWDFLLHGAVTNQLAGMVNGFRKDGSPVSLEVKDLSAIKFKVLMLDSNCNLIPGQTISTDNVVLDFTCLEVSWSWLIKGSWNPDKKFTSLFGYLKSKGDHLTTISEVPFLVKPNPKKIVFGDVIAENGRIKDFKRSGIITIRKNPESIEQFLRAFQLGSQILSARGPLPEGFARNFGCLVNSLTAGGAGKATAKLIRDIDYLFSKFQWDPNVDLLEIEKRVYSSNTEILKTVLGNSFKSEHRSGGRALESFLRQRGVEVSHESMAVLCSAVIKRNEVYIESLEDGVHKSHVKNVQRALIKLLGLEYPDCFLQNCSEIINLPAIVKSILADRISSQRIEEVNATEFR